MDAIFDVKHAVEEEVVLAAVTTNGYALEYASDDRRNDHEVVLAAVHSHRRALAYVPTARRAPYRRAGPTETRLLFAYMPFPFYLPEELVVTHILPRCHRV